ncbi:MAG TPA: DUF177 domain-containing protein [Clostridia bacterium]
MSIDISRITKVDGASIDVSYTEKMDDLSGVVDGFGFPAPVVFNGKFLNTGNALKLEGDLRVSYTTSCSRCLKSIQADLSINIKESFVNSGKASDSDEEAYTYTGNLVSIDKALKDNIVLNLPAKQLCSENCKGLCQSCGCDLNENDCNCSTDVVNPKMEVLKGFFD